jgi:hypothetical protein
VIVKQAREAARQWVIEEGSSMPGFSGAYATGSTNWLPDDATLATTSDLDVMVVLADPNSAGNRGKFIYRNILLDVSYIGNDRLRSPDLALSDYHLAPSLRTTKIILDPLGHLTALVAAVSSDYAKRQWVHKRCAHARNRVLEYLRSLNQEAPLHDQVIAWLFAAGITTHILLVAGLKNPTVRTRHLAVRELLADYGCLDFHEALLELLRCARISRGQVDHHLATVTRVFDAAKEAIKTRFPFASDISESARPIAISGSMDLIARGYYREAMFWIAVTHSRCQKVLCHDAPGEVKERFSNSYQELVGDLGVASFSEVQRRCEEVERILPRVWELAEAIIAANEGIEPD